MRVVCRSFIMIVLLICIMLPLHAQERFQWLGETPRGNSYFDTENVRFARDADGNIKQGIFEVVITYEINEKGRQDAINNRKKYNLPTDGYEQFDFAVERSLYDLSGKRYCYLEIVEFSSDDSILQRVVFDQMVWYDIKPGTAGEDGLSRMKQWIEGNLDKVKSPK